MPPAIGLSDGTPRCVPGANVNSTVSTPSVETPLPPATTQSADAPATLPTLNDDGSRRWLKPRFSRGRFLTARRTVAYLLIAIFTLIPHIRLNGKPLVLLDLSTRRFTIFGATFLPTDTLLLALLLVGVFLTIFLVTAMFGRVWCGWACPQTVYMEFLFRPIERLCQGAPGRASKSWLVTSGFGRMLKPVLFFVLACYLAHTFLAYFVGVDKLRLWVTQSPLEHPTPFLVMVVVTGLMLFDFGYFREQTCLVACPYGRLQSALLDRQSLIVGYDRGRGEPRGKAKRGKAAEAPAAPAAAAVALPVLNSASGPARSGDCVDCGMCVTTCPTGIDIRNGLQMECIGCAQCIDACDAVMAKLNRPGGLIRYSSAARLSGEPSHLLRLRTVVYPVMLSIVAGAFLVVLLSRQPADVTVLRGLGKPYTQLADGMIENHARVKIINRTDQSQTYTIGIGHGDGFARLTAEENPITLAAGESRTMPVVVLAPVSEFSNGHRTLRITVTDGGTFRDEQRYLLQGPVGPSTRGSPHQEHESSGERGDGVDHPRHDGGGS